MNKLFTSLVLSVLALVAAAPANAAYSTPVKVADAGFGPRAFANPSGGGAVSFEWHSSVYAVPFGADLTPGAAVALTGSEPNVPAYGTSRAGDVYAADRQDLPADDSRIVIGRLAPDGTATTTEINEPGAIENNPAIAVGRGPGPLLAYDTATPGGGKSKVRLARLSRSGVVESDVEVGGGFLPQIAAHGKQAAVAWPGGNRILATTVSDSGKVAKPVAIQRSDRERLTDIAWGGASQPVALVANPFKELRVVRFGDGKPRSLRVAKGRLVRNGTLAVDGKGGTWIAWTEREGEGLLVRVRQLSAAGKLGPVQTLSKPGTDVGAPQIAAAGPAGASVAWWSDGQKKGQSIRVAELTGKGRARAPRTVVTETEAGIHTLSIAIDSKGRNLVTWYQLGGGIGGVYLAREG